MSLRFDPLPADPRLEAAIATTRFGLGARPGELAAVQADPQGWLRAQITPAGADLPRDARGQPLPSAQEDYQAFLASRAAEKAAGTDQDDRHAAVQPLHDASGAEVLARAQLGTATPASFRER